MGLQVSIDIYFSEKHSPKEIFKKLLDTGWEINFENEVSYLRASDLDDYDWQATDVDNFNINEFINSHDYMGKIGISVVANRESGGEILIFPDYLSLSLSINRRYLFETQTMKIPDFNWYLERLSQFLNIINPQSIRCDAG